MGSLGSGSGHSYAPGSSTPDAPLTDAQMLARRKLLGDPFTVGASQSNTSGSAITASLADALKNGTPAPLALPDPLEVFTKAVRGKLVGRSPGRSISSLFGGG